MLCHHCGIRPIAPGKLKYCRNCGPLAKQAARRERRKAQKAMGSPTWRVYGWASEEAYRAFHRTNMQKHRAS